MMNAAKICMAIAILATLNSLWGTWSHLYEPQYDIHAQLHFSREVFVSLAILAISAYVMYGPAKNRSGLSWTLMTIGIATITLGFWLSILITGAEVPSLRAGLNHVINTVFGLLAVGLSWKAFFNR